MRNGKLALLRSDDRSPWIDEASLFRGDAFAGHGGWLAGTPEGALGGLSRGWLRAVRRRSGWPLSQSNTAPGGVNSLGASAGAAS